MRGVSRMNFIVRVERDTSGGVRGVIERVRTGTKETFSGVDAIGALIGRMIEIEAAEAPSRRESRALSPDREGEQ